jgi:amino acid transporter
MPAFTGTPPGWLVPTLMCVLATVLDAALVLALYAFGVWAFRDRLWFRPPRFRRYLVVVLLAVAAN